MPYKHFTNWLGHWPLDLEFSGSIPAQQHFASTDLKSLLVINKQLDGDEKFYGHQIWI